MPGVVGLPQELDELRGQFRLGLAQADALQQGLHSQHHRANVALALAACLCYPGGFCNRTRPYSRGGLYLLYCGSFAEPGIKVYTDLLGHAQPAMQLASPAE